MKQAVIMILLSGVLVTGCSTHKKDQVKLVLDTQSDLGEGAVWDHQKGELIWVNITKKILNIYNPKLNHNKEMLTGQMIGTVVPAESGKMIVALENGLYQLDPQTGSKIFIADPEENITGNRFNDGKCDPVGRFWAGTMSMTGEKEAGALYRLDPNGKVTQMISKVTTSNGIVWSQNQNKMYYIDTPTRKVMAWDYEPETGNISNPKPAVEIPDEMGYPDGMTMDAEGHLWIALWNGSAVGCWNPENGELIRKIDIPAKNVTSCAFGDDDLGTLYITTARTGTNEEELKKFPHAGGLFKTRPGVTGVKTNYFKGEF
ncbi:MAG: SMP-30/gluconolactonase/LRE family protein [Mariniphaga sp.]|nr:SMP-30/gluconolactonase/LRE family protein [Mariniphaga sp.]